MNIEFNKEEFTKAILKFFTFPLDAFSSKDEIDAINLSNRHEVSQISNYIPECVDFLYLNNELLVLKNSKLILEKNLEKIKQDMEKIDDKLIIEATNVKIKHIENFIKKIESSIETNEIIDLSHINNAKDTTRPYTNHEIALFFLYLFHELKIDKSYNKTKAAEIILKIMGNKPSVNNIVNTNIYKILKNPIGFYKTKKEPDSKKLQANLRTVKNIFESLGINTSKIDADMSND